MTNKIYITEDGVKREMTKDEKEQHQNDIKEKELLEAEYKKKEEARKSALEKLAEIAGLTKDEMAALGL